MSLPCNIDAERFVLGSILLDDSLWPAVAGSLTGEDFSLEKHRRIYRHMGLVADSGAAVDRVTLANSLMAANELESVDGLSYLVSLDDGLPQVPNIDEYVGILRTKATQRALVYAGQAISERAMRGDEAPERILADANASLLKLGEGCAKSTLVTPAGIIQAAGGIGAYLDRRNANTGISTGYTELDQMCGGLERGKLYIIGARPAQGKTAFVMNVAERVAVPASGDGHTVLVFSLEMGKEELLDRLICSRARINTRRFASGNMRADEEKAAWKAASEIAADDRIFIDDKANTSETEMWAKIRKHQARADVGLVVVDYLQLLLNCKDSERVGAMSRISRNMKLIAKDCKVPVVALSQLSRAVDGRGNESNPDGWRPILSDLRESGSVEQDADLVASIVRLEYYLKDRPELRGQADLEILKQRGGPIGRIPLTWMAECVRFEQGGAAEER